MIKNFVLDTSVCIYDPYCLDVFNENNIWISNIVLKELDHLKNKNGASGYNAREFIREINKRLTENDYDNYDINSNKKYIKIRNSNIYLFSARDTEILNDLNIIKSAEIVIDIVREMEDSNQEVIIVSKDTNQRNLCSLYNIKTEDYRNKKISEVPTANGLYLCFDYITINELFHKGMTSNKPLYRSDNGEFDFRNNDYYLGCFEGTDPKEQNSGSVLLRYCDGVFYNISNNYNKINYIKAKNYKQKFAIDALTNDLIKLVFLIGGAGTGKTLLSLAVGLEEVFERKKYEKIIVIRPIEPVGRDLGYLPGSADEKISPYNAPIFDNLQLIFNSAIQKNENKVLNVIDYLKEVIEFVPLAFIRGRTFHNSFILVDEAQNLTPLEAKTIITRVGEGSKVVFTGDIKQIDRQYLDERDNGLSVASERFRLNNSKLATTIYLTETERSDLSKEAVLLL